MYHTLSGPYNSKSYIVSANYYRLLWEHYYDPYNIVKYHQTLLNNIEDNICKENVNVEHIDLNLLPSGLDMDTFELHLHKLMRIISFASVIHFILLFGTGYLQLCVFTICELIITLNAYWIYCRVYYWMDFIVRPRGFENIGQIKDELEYYLNKSQSHVVLGLDGMFVVITE
eukprot:719110_1